MDTGQALLAGMTAGLLGKAQSEQPIIAEVEVLTDDEGYRPEIRVGLRMGDGIESYVVAVRKEGA